MPCHKKFFLAFGLLLSASAQGTNQDFYFFQCNSTSWNYAEKSRLQPGSKQGQYSIEFMVREKWMLDVGDSCRVVRSAAPNRLTASNWKTFGIDVSTGPAFVAAGSTYYKVFPLKGDEVWEPYRIRFQQLGIHRMTLNPEQSWIRFDAY